MEKELFLKFLLLFNALIGIIYVELNEKNLLSFYILTLSIIIFLYAIHDVYKLFKKKRDEFKEYLILSISFINLIFLYYIIETLFQLNLFAQERLNFSFIIFITMIYIFINLMLIIKSISKITEIEIKVFEEQKTLKEKINENQIFFYLKNFFNKF